MGQRLIYIALWESELKEMVAFLKRNGYDDGEVNRLEGILGRGEEANAS